MEVTATTQRAGSGRAITFLVALAVFAQESTWNFYESQVPPMLLPHVASAAVVGLLMGMDNILGVLIQPWFGNRSDSTRTSWGRRMPYLVVGMPLAALLFLLIPLSAATLPLLIATMFGFALVANSFKPIAEALLPDFVSPERRSRANAVVRIASALTVIMSAVVSLLVIDDNPVAAFAIPAGTMVLATAVLALTVRDSRSAGYRAALAEDRADAAAAGVVTKVRTRDAALDILRDPDRSRLLVIVSIAVFGAVWASSRSLVTPYGMEALGLSRGDAGGLTLVSGVVYIVAAFPLALLAERIGRLRVMLAGAVVFGIAMVAGTLLPTATGTTVALSIAAVGGGAFMINAVVVLWNLAPSARVLGTYGGIYTVGWGLGGFLGPAAVGALVDITGWHLMLLDIAGLTLLPIATVTAVLLMQRRASASAL